MLQLLEIGCHVMVCVQYVYRYQHDLLVWWTHRTSSLFKESCINNIYILIYSFQRDSAAGRNLLGDGVAQQAQAPGIRCYIQTSIPAFTPS
jgi:hypothetical protein